MRVAKAIFIAFIALFLSVAFSKAPRGIAIDGFNAERWRKDARGCHSIRVNQSEKLLKNKSLLLRRTKKDILKLLGPPDIIKGNKYYWCLEYGNQCLISKNAAVGAKVKDVSLAVVAFDKNARAIELKVVVP